LVEKKRKEKEYELNSRAVIAERCPWKVTIKSFSTKSQILTVPSSYLFENKERERRNENRERRQIVFSIHQHQAIPSCYSVRVEHLLECGDGRHDVILHSLLVAGVGAQH